MSICDELVQAALSYAARGWPVFPLVPGTKKPACPAHTAASCNGSDPHCRGGHTTWEQRATRDPDRIRRGWAIRPYGIGITPGPAGLLVIDTDVRKPHDPVPAPWDTTHVRTGDGVLANLAAQAGHELPATWTVATPSAGRHRYYLAPSGLRLGNTAGKLGWLIDTRGHGGYVAAPPTRTPAGRYTRLDYPEPVPLPDWLADLLTAPAAATNRDPAPRPWPQPTPAISSSSSYVAAALAGETSHVRAAQPRRRNHALFAAAIALGQLVGGGLVDEHTVRDQLREASVDHILAGFTAAEADATITSGLTRGKTEPRNNGRTAA